MGCWKSIVIIFCLVIMAGCCSTFCPPKPCDPVIVPCPKPVVSPRQPLPIKNITATTQPADVMKAYVLSVQILLGRVTELETVLDGYR